jgi:hypothetical protein
MAFIQRQVRVPSWQPFEEHRQPVFCTDNRWLQTVPDAVNFGQSRSWQTAPEVQDAAKAAG